MTKDEPSSQRISIETLSNNDVTWTSRRPTTDRGGGQPVALFSMHERLRGRAYAFLKRAAVLPQARIGGTVLLGFGSFAGLATEPGRQSSDWQHGAGWFRG